MEINGGNSNQLWWHCKSSNREWVADAALFESNAAHWRRIDSWQIKEKAAAPSKVVWWIDPNGFVHSTPLLNRDKS